MNIVEQSWSWVRKPDGHELLRIVEEAGRTCYKSEAKRDQWSHVKFAEKMLKSGHHAMIEHAQIPPVRVITDRGVTHEIVRHRLFSYAQESTRYCNYSKDKFGNELTMIMPVWFTMGMADGSEVRDAAYEEWEHACKMAGESYMMLLKHKQSAQQARSVLPNSLKTEIIITGNLREWRHFFSLRCSPKAHPQMQKLALSMLFGFCREIPVLFADLMHQYIGDQT